MTWNITVLYEAINNIQFMKLKVYVMSCDTDIKIWLFYSALYSYKPIWYNMKLDRINSYSYATMLPLNTSAIIYAI